MDVRPHPVPIHQLIMNILGDIKSRKLLIIKGLLFAVVALLAGGGLWLQSMQWETVILLLIFIFSVWCHRSLEPSVWFVVVQNRPLFSILRQFPCNGLRAIGILEHIDRIL